MTLDKMLNHYRLTTAEIYYHFPDHPSLLQSYIWQDLDLSPDFPELKKFLHFWEHSLDGKLHSVEIARCEFLEPPTLIARQSSIKLH